MDSRLANTWRLTVNERKFIETALLSGIRIDGRNPYEYRKLSIKFGREDGSSEVQLGQTHVMGFVTCQLLQPYRDRPNEGTLSIFTEFSPMADPSFEPGRPGESAVELGRIIDRGLRESRAVDTESLCVLAGKLVWAIRIDLHILDNGGNLVDAANIAALAALLTFRRPECSLGGEDGQEVILHPPEVEAYKTERALSKIKRHPASIALEGIGSGGNVKGKQNLSFEHKGVSELSRNLMERSKLASEGSCATQNDGEGETKLSELSGNKRDGGSTNLVGGPTSWDPYSKGVDSDFLKASLASRVKVAPEKKPDSVGERKPTELKPEEPPEDNKSASMEIKASEAGLRKDGPKTLKDAVKPKHKRKKKASASANKS